MNKFDLTYETLNKVLPREMNGYIRETLREVTPVDMFGTEEEVTPIVTYKTDKGHKVFAIVVPGKQPVIRVMDVKGKSTIEETIVEHFDKQGFNIIKHTFKRGYSDAIFLDEFVLENLKLQIEKRLKFGFYVDPLKKSVKDLINMIPVALDFYNKIKFQDVDTVDINFDDVMDVNDDLQYVQSIAELPSGVVWEEGNPSALVGIFVDKERGPHVRYQNFEDYFIDVEFEEVEEETNDFGFGWETTKEKDSKGPSRDEIYELSESGIKAALEFLVKTADKKTKKIESGL